MTDSEILRLNRLYNRGEITLEELSDAFQENGVTLKRFSMVLLCDLIRFALCLLELGLLFGLFLDWLVWCCSGR